MREHYPGVSMPNDPVCYTQVDDDRKFPTTYKGREYYFCTGFCERKFEEEPDKYARIAGDMNLGNDISC
jgi:YHS domain-containing protein